jgi:hypothetical protein
MFHGTLETSPQAVCTSEYGIDMRYGDKGMFGRASYFAFNSTYSVRYAHAPASDPASRQMILVSVTTGNVEVREPDGNIRLPAKGYHSIRGRVAPGHDAIMVYEFCRSYPYYIITFNASS